MELCLGQWHTIIKLQGEATELRRVLIKELSAMDACNTISDSWENVVTSVRLLDVVTVIR